MEFCRMLEKKTAVYNAITGHETAYQAVGTIHLFGLTLLLGTIVLLSLRLLGAMLKKQPVAELAADLLPYQSWGLGLMGFSGIFMFIATAVRCYGNTSFFG